MLLKKRQFVNLTTLFAEPDEYATEPMALCAIHPHRCPPMRTIAYQSPKHLLQLIILCCPSQVACEAIEWVSDAAQQRMTLVLRDYGMTFVPASLCSPTFA